jgi:peptidoglycan/xylan/chitin deacetylase (PgdA/CDA1 family)
MRDMRKERKSLKSLAALVLALAAAFALVGCGVFNRDAARPTEIAISTPETQPTASPTEEATPVPVTEEPTEEPTAEPTEEPTAEPTPAPTNTPKPTDAVNPNVGRKVYITVDDGPWTHTPELLDILARYGIKATFFTIGNSIKTHPEEARRIVEEGHLLACHTMTHEFGIIYTSPEAFVADVNDWREQVIKTIGYDAGAYVFRFPGGSNNSSVKKDIKKYLAAMHEAGYIAMDWNLALNDKWLAGNKDNLPLQDYFWKSYQETYSWYHNVDPLILILHDTEYEAIKVLPRILDDLIAKGFVFGTCDELTEDYIMWNYK